MSREKIKKKVYEKLIGLFYNKHEFEVEMSQYPNDGEDRQLYTEVYLDSLDVLTFIISLEQEFNIQIDNDLFRYGCSVRNIIDYIYDKLK